MACQPSGDLMRTGWIGKCMETKRKFYWLWAAIGLLLCLNLLTVGWVVKRTEAVRVNRPLPEGALMRGLGLSPAQMKQFRQSRIQFRQQVKPHEDSLRILRTALLDRVSDSLVTDDELNRLTEAMSRQNRQITRFRFRHWHQVRSFCTQEQQAMFDQWLRRVGQGGNNAAFRERLRARQREKSR